MTDAGILALAGGLVALVLLLTVGRRWLTAHQQRLSTCGNSARPGGTLDAAAWFIGPDLKGYAGGAFGVEHRSPNMPTHPLAHPEGLTFQFPVGWGRGHVNYLTFNHGPLTGKTRIVARFRIEGPAGLAFVNDTGGQNAAVTAHFQQRSDDWSGIGKFETYRWWATFAPVTLAGPGEYEITAPLDGAWTAIETSGRTSPGFAAAIADTCCVGLTFGGGSGYGHGLAASTPATFVLTHFGVE